jgi:hypothetical protein
LAESVETAPATGAALAVVAAVSETAAFCPRQIIEHPRLAATTTTVRFTQLKLTRLKCVLIIAKPPSFK